MHQRVPSAAARSYLVTALFTTALVLAPAALLGQEVRFLGDLYTGGTAASDSRPEQFVAVEDTVVFVASDVEHGEELWRTDGTAGGTELLMDIRPGRFGSRPDELVGYQGELVYFSADDGSAGEELWQTDGTPEGTQRVGDLQPGPLGSNPQGLTVAGNDLFFRAATTAEGSELWVLPSGGSPELVDDLRSGPDSSLPLDLLPIGTRVAFTAYTEATGREIYVSDGTSGGTELFDLSLTQDLDPELLASIGDLLFYSAAPEDFGRELYRIDVASGLVRRLTYLPSDDGSARIEYPAVLGSLLLFSVTADGSSSLWKSDGESIGTEEIAALEAEGLVPLSSEVLFVSDGDLWSSDGTSGGTGLVADLDDNILHLAFGPHGPEFLAPHGGELFFHTTGEVWSTDGTGPGTLAYDDCDGGSCSGIEHMASGGTTLYFSLRDSFAGEEPWRAAAGNVDRLADLAQDIGHADPAWFTALDGHAFFSAEVDGAGTELVSWDGSEEPASVFEDLAPGTGSTLPRELTTGTAGLFYVATDPVAGREPRLLPDPSSPSQLAGDVDTFPSLLTPAGGGLYFAGDDDDNVEQLWHSDGTTAVQVSFFPADAWGVDVSTRPALLDGELYFSADDGSLGDELWKSDGFDVELVIDLELGPGRSAPDYLTPHGGLLYFSAAVDSRPGLWKTDGTFQNTEMLWEGDGIGLLHSVGPKLLFVGVEESTGIELWSTDGTVGGTQRLTDIGPGPEHGLPVLGLSDFAVSGDRLFFVAGYAETGEELWISDGTPEGTHLVRDLRPGPESSAPSYLTPLPDGGVVFSAYGEGSGIELWRSDGTADGTFRVTDIAPGEASSDPLHATVAGDWVVFQANDGTTGREAWAYDWTTDPLLFADGFESGNTSAW